MYRWRALVTVLQTYVKAFAKDELPEIGTLFDATARVQHLTLKGRAFDKYKKAMDAHCGPACPYVQPDALKAVRRCAARRKSVLAAPRRGGQPGVGILRAGAQAGVPHARHYHSR